MIIAKTKMQKLPDSCKRCGLSLHISGYEFGEDRYCPISKRRCPMEVSKQSGCMKYSKPKWCPLEEAKEAQQ